MEIKKAMDTVTDLLTCGDYILKDNHRITAEEKKEALETLQSFVDGITLVVTSEEREPARSQDRKTEQLKAMDEIIRFKLGDLLIGKGFAKERFFEEDSPGGRTIKAIAQVYVYEQHK